MTGGVGAYVRAKAWQWQPGKDTVWALVSIPLLWGCYVANTQLSAGNPILALVISFLIGNIVVCTLLPALVVRKVAGEGAWGLGFTRHRLWSIVPVTAAVSSGIGTLQSGLSFDWANAASGVAVLLAQVVILVLVFRRPAPVSAPVAPAVR